LKLFLDTAHHIGTARSSGTPEGSSTRIDTGNEQFKDAYQRAFAGTGDG